MEAIKNLLKHLADAQTVEISEAEIRALKKSETADRMPQAIRDAAADRRLRVGAAQSDKGLKYLKSIIWTPKGVLRKTPQAEQFGERERHVIENFSHFNFTGLRDISRGSGRPYYCPSYLGVATNGTHFEYVAGSWQSGVSVEVIS